MKVHAQKPRQLQQQASPSVTRLSAKPLAASPTAHPIQHLQRSTRNPDLQQLLPSHARALEIIPDTSATSPFAHDFGRRPVYFKSPVSFQAKLTINTPGDIFEQEADRVSEQVASMPEPNLQSTYPGGSGCPRCRNEQVAPEQLQTKRVQANDKGESVAPSIVNEVLGMSGRPLDSNTRGFMESRFGHDFSQVRVHADPHAADAAAEVGARALTVNRNIVFGAGEYAPQTVAGRRLLAHELTHVVQQGASVHLQNIAGRTSATDERHDGQVAETTADGRSAEKPLATYDPSPMMRATLGQGVIQRAELPATEMAETMSGDGEPEHDFTYFAQGVTYYVKFLNEAGVVSMVVLSGQEETDEVLRPSMKQFAKENKGSDLPSSWLTKQWMYHPIYYGKYTPKFDRWSDLVESETKLKCAHRPCTSPPFTIEELTQEYLATHPGTTLPGLTRPPKPPEFVVLLLEDPQTKATYTYMFWNETREAKQAGRPKTVPGDVAYYSFERPEGFESAWGDQNAFTFLSKMDAFVAGKSFTRESGLRPGSYEAYRSATDELQISEGGQTKTVKRGQAWGKIDALHPNLYYAKMPPLSPPQEIIANFASDKFDIETMQDDGANFSKEQFLKNLKDWVMYLGYYPDVKITIEGHTSRKGSDNDNRELSKKRAASVRDYMIAHAEEWSGKPLAEARITAVGRGSEEATLAGEDKNNNDLQYRKIVIKYDAGR